MHNISPPAATVTLFYRDGGRTTYASKEHALRALGLTWISENVGEHFVVGDSTCDPWSGRAALHYAYILRDHEGKPLQAWDFRRKPTRRYAFQPTPPHGSPVPYVHKSRGGNGWYRRPGTQAERRMNQAVDADEPQARAARTGTSLPSTWDDVRRTDADQQGWKRHRARQWKGSGPA